MNNTLLKKLAQKYTLLYVEDDKLLRELGLEFFSELFKKVVVAENGKEALSLYQNESFDLVITDIMMPKMNGIDFSREVIRRNKKQKIIVVSAYNETEYFIELIKIGISGFIQKPLTKIHVFDVLFDICKELDEERDINRYMELGDSFIWDSESKVLLHQKKEVVLTVNESILFDLFISNKEQKFTDFEIFNHLYYSDIEKEFSTNAIKSLLKRLRKKLPHELIKTYKNMGYGLSIN